MNASPLPAVRWKRSVRDETETLAVARALAPSLRAGDVVALRGELGAGKTVFARGLVRTLAGDVEVPSPTFNLVLTYEPDDPASPAIWHFDLYRLESPEDAFELGIEEAFDDAISIIEWPGNLGHHLPARRIDIELGPGPGEGARMIGISLPGGEADRFDDVLVQLEFRLETR